MADAVWLAAHWSLTGRLTPGESAPAVDDEPLDGTLWPPAPSSDAQQEPTAERSRPFATLSLPAPDPEGAVQTHLVPPVLPGERPHARGQAARSAQLARALHRLGRRVPSREELLLDEELTAERMVLDELWLPYLRPGWGKAFDLVVLIDNGPTMAIWREQTAALGNAAEHSGAFRSVRTVQLDVSHAGTGVPRLRWGAKGSTAELGEILDGRGERLFLVVTDGLGHGWAAYAADILLHRLGGAGPTALIHLLPPHMRHRSSLHPHALLLEAGGFGVSNRNLYSRPPLSGPDPLRPLPETDGEAMAVPVLSLKPGSLAAWADLVVGEPGVRRELPVVLAGSLNTGKPAPGLHAPQLPRGAAAAVRRFFALATPGARRLATHLAAVPFEFDLIQQLRERTMPDTGAEHLAEILMGGLIDWDHADGQRPEFADGVREALLATTTRTQLATVVTLLGELPAAGEHGIALHAALRDPAGSTLPDPSAWAWQRTELAVMRALAGPYSQRARRIEATASESMADRHSLAEPSPAMASREASEATLTAAESPMHSEDQRSAPPAVMVNVPQRNASFVGRAVQLRALEERLADQDVVCVLPDWPLSSGGVGTTELALEYVHRHADHYDLICWIPAGCESLVLATLANLADPLGLDRASSEAHTVDQSVHAVLDALRTGAPYDRWLLVLDNAEDVEAVRRHLPTGGPGKVVVTSRSVQWQRAAIPVKVGVFERDESVELLRNLSPSLPEEDADRLAEALGDVPLAVEQAGSWHRLTGMPADEYLELLDRRSPAVVELAQAANCPVSPAAAWDIALEELRVLNPHARRLLDLCAGMAPEPIPLALLDQGRTPDGSPPESEPLPDGLSPAVRALSQFSLAKVDHHGGTLQLHRVLQAVLLAGLPPEQRERMREATHQVLAAGRPGHFSSPREWPAYWSLLPHVLASQAVTGTDLRVRALVYDTVQFLDHRGDHEGALALGGQAWAAWLEASGEEHTDAVRMAKTYASLLRRTGRIAESVPLTENALEVSRRIAADTDDLIDSLCELADARRHQGRLREARDLSMEATEVSRSLLGSEDPVTLRATHSLGVDLRLCGRFGEALQLDRQNARLGEELFGPADPFTLDSLNAVSTDLRESGDYPGARELQEELYDRARSQLGEEHRLTLRIAANLAVCRRRDGALSAAALLSEETMWHCRARYGSDHLDSLAAAINAAVDRRLAGDAEWSRQLDETTAGRLRARLGEDHLCTLVVKANLAATMRTLGHLDEAQALEDDVAYRLDGTVGPRHVTALTVALGRANTAYAGLDFERAREIDEANLPLLAEIAGEQHPLRLACTANLALDFLGLGRGAEADALQRTALEGFTAAVRADHPWLLAARQRRRIECDLAYVLL
ncbi:FxSxx-COOH system tetratricopeptide repeat protein [Streptomyces lutosisoli]|uniref:FxSxx-COOH system tetratricopeptide repeat protein n=1 Tax=Streptomyces lutosisoli TaxID=2665721 RepID=A0ABW2VVH3_9ACTN